MGLMLRKNQSGSIEGTVGFNCPQTVRSMETAFVGHSVTVDGVEMEAENMRYNHVEDRGNLTDVWTLTYRFRRCDDGEYAGDLVIRVDMSTSYGKAGTYTWVPKTEPDEPLDTEGIMEYLNGIEVV